MTNLRKVTIRNAIGACALVLGMAAFAPNESLAAPCAVMLVSTNPDGSLTNATDCGLASPTNASEAQTGIALNAASPGGISTWTHIDRDESAGEIDPGFSFTGSTSGTWTISDTGFTSYILTLKDGKPLKNDFLWFLVDMSTPLVGTWQMYGTNENAKEVSHMDLFGASPRQVPEPGILFLLGSGLLGLGFARLRTSRT